MNPFDPYHHLIHCDGTVVREIGKEWRDEFGFVSLEEKKEKDKGPYPMEYWRKMSVKTETDKNPKDAEKEKSEKSNVPNGKQELGPSNDGHRRDFKFDARLLQHFTSDKELCENHRRESDGRDFQYQNRRSNAPRAEYRSKKVFHHHYPDCSRGDCQRRSNRSELK